MTSHASRIRISVMGALLVALALAATPAAAAKPGGTITSFACYSTGRNDNGLWDGYQIGAAWSNVKVTRIVSTVTSPDPVDATLLTREGTFSARDKATSWVGYHGPLQYQDTNGFWWPSRIDSYRLQAFNGQKVVLDVAWTESTGSAIPPC